MVTVSLSSTQKRLCNYQHFGRSMAHAVSRRLHKAVARVCALVSLCRICDGQSGTGTVFSASSSVSPVNIILP
jgi:hypothetical protein